MTTKPELARLYRYTDQLPDTTLCVWKPEENLLVINTLRWAQLAPYEQREIERTPRTIVVNHSWAIDDAA